ncbi:hypothetical protein BU24DRAFT_167845 [Aaosphaeria arxii CBS 175.79]|uniref:Uncharacterized protein n=1 Tax=Aaosphaeria arxii CBS 175.79 TaxID=1450172 RepID=A0A6A5Y126_9PLEO|nr:uncharacterized protein BU24DRAFT_167845 [Aaosphaeria arxii CBS 175.79]KAF2018264.1 hypothetical protein BU24DRAFT_167845 [Aaosphaeria arxii CBS 175.79]
MGQRAGDPPSSAERSQFRSNVLLLSMPFYMLTMSINASVALESFLSFFFWLRLRRRGRLYLVVTAREKIDRKANDEHVALLY